MEAADNIISSRAVTYTRNVTFILVTLREGDQRWKGCQMTDEQRTQAAERLMTDPNVLNFRIVTAQTYISGGNTTAYDLDPARLMEALEALNSNTPAKE